MLLLFEIPCNVNIAELFPLESIFSLLCCYVAYGVNCQL